MRLWPRSLFGRLLAIACLATAAALLVAGIAIGHTLGRFVMHALDDRLDAQIGVLTRAVRPDGTLDPTRAIDLPGFGVPGSGWTWQVSCTDGRRWASGHDPAPAPPPPPPPRFEPDERRRRGPHPGEARGAAGERLHVRSLALATAAGTVTITASGPRRIAEAPVREAMVPLLLTLALLGGALGLATLVQLRLGLKPLRHLREALAQVIAGERQHVPHDQPAELVGLVTELNLLIDRNAAGLEHARRHVANLAHGLKTPLAALSLRLEESGRDPDGELAAMLGKIDRRVAHHLRRARAAAPGGMQTARTAVATAVDDLLAVLARVHADRAVDAVARIGPALIVATDPQDLDEMLGNLLDNAWRHARGAIRIGAQASNSAVAIAIEDDGPGLDGAALAKVRVRGRRIDEREIGYGFGLAITDELAELNAGHLALDRSPTLGGLRAVLTLPIARAQQTPRRD